MLANNRRNADWLERNRDLASATKVMSILAFIARLHCDSHKKAVHDLQLGDVRLAGTRRLQALPLHGRASRNGQDGAGRRLLTMSLLRRSASALFVVAALLLPGGNVAAQAGGSPASLKWAVAPSLLPPGAMIAVISGNPAGSGRATIALSMPDGYRMPPHFHPSYERVEVKQGLLLVGIGDRLDPKRTLPLAVGDTILAPAGMHHYSIAKGTTIVAVSFIAPYTITYVNAYEAPRQPTSFPYGY